MRDGRDTRLGALDPLVAEGAAELSRVAWTAVSAAESAVAEAGTLSFYDKAIVLGRLLSPIGRFVVSSPADEKLARLAAAKKMLDDTYEIMRAKWRLTAFRDVLKSEAAGAAEDLEAAYGAVVEWSGNVIAAAQGIENVPIVEADRFISSYYSNFSGQLAHVSNLLDAILRLLAKLAGAAADLPGWSWLLGLGLGLIGYALWRFR